MLAGCAHKTVARVVVARQAAGGGLPERERRPLVDPFAGKIEELVDRSRGGEPSGAIAVRLQGREGRVWVPLWDIFEGLC